MAEPGRCDARGARRRREGLIGRRGAGACCAGGGRPPLFGRAFPGSLSSDERFEVLGLERAVHRALGKSGTGAGGKGA